MGTLRGFIMIIDKYMHTISVGVLKFNFSEKNWVEDDHNTWGCSYFNI